MTSYRFGLGTLGTVLLLTASFASAQFTQPAFTQPSATGRSARGGRNGPGPVASITSQPGDPATLEETEARISKLFTQIDDILGERAGTPEEAIDSKTSELGKVREQLNIEIAGKKTREQALQAKIDELTATAHRLADSDEMLAQLKKIADIKKAAAEHAHETVKVGVATSAEESASVIQAAEAIVHVTERREAILASVGGGALPALNKELLAVSLDLNEQMAKLSYAQKRIEELKHAHALLSEARHMQTIRASLILFERRPAPPN